MFMLIHVVDELDALALILELRVSKGRPAAVLTLILVGWPLRRYWKSDCYRSGSGGNRARYRISSRADDRDGA